VLLEEKGKGSVLIKGQANKYLIPHGLSATVGVSVGDCVPRSTTNSDSLYCLTDSVKHSIS